MPRFRPIDAEKPATRPQKYGAAMYIRAEFQHRSALYIRRNEQYNNEARIINRKRCRGLRAAGYDYPPNGLIRLIDPLSGLACREAPFRLQHFNTLPMAELVLVGIFYGFNWNPNQAPVVMNPGPWHTRLEMIEEYKAFIGANNH
ncbi:uncharacterized protein H6S33_010812 [Morchella sextelata]|uniref:uncharacterized protein n=1 Tax=Morchella sextelata TaxID=1174677 RepID=UPI001D055FD9|nr:uncharacterized protein H6S33_010812 [Morchella sextelata]KAH0611547.1 hypothetical protein H6S33_010812 [Morchella sextelata]